MLKVDNIIPLWRDPLSQVQKKMENCLALFKLPLLLPLGGSLRQAFHRHTA